MKAWDPLGEMFEEVCKRVKSCNNFRPYVKREGISISQIFVALKAYGCNGVSDFNFIENNRPKDLHRLENLTYYDPKITEYLHEKLVVGKMAEDDVLEKLQKLLNEVDTRNQGAKGTSGSSGASGPTFIPISK